MADSLRRFAKFSEEQRTVLRQTVLLLRFRDTLPTPTSHKFFSYNTIAKAVGVPYNTVQHLCRHALQPTKKQSLFKRIHELSQEHRDFLLKPLTLKQWAGLTLQERTVLFHRRFTDKRISTTSLRNGVRRKKVRQVKVRPPAVQIRLLFQCNDVLAQLREELVGPGKVIYVDETVFSKKALQLTEWSGPFSNLTID